MSGVEAVISLLTSLPQVITAVRDLGEELSKLGKLVVKLARGLPFIDEKMRKYVEDIDIKQHVFIPLLSNWASQLGKEEQLDQLKYVMGKLTSIAEMYKSNQEVLQRWTEDSTDRKFKDRAVILAGIYLRSREKSIMDNLKRLDQELSLLGTDAVILGILSGVVLPKKSLENHYVPAEMELGISVAMARKLVEEGKNAQQLDFEQLGESVTFEKWGPDLALGVGTNRQFSNCIFNHRKIENLDNYPKLLEDTQRIASLLQDPLASNITNEKGRKWDRSDFGLLTCVGYVEITEHDWAHVDLILKLPRNTMLNPPPRSLRHLLAASREIGAQHPLNDRLEFAVKLTKALLFVHSADIIHKGVRPEAILVVENSAIPTEQKKRFPNGLGNPYLLGFGQSRKTGLTHRKTFDDNMNILVYHHPRHQIPSRNEDYHMLDDIYSLGIVLMEIGIWRSLFEREVDWRGIESWEVDRDVVEMYDPSKNTERDMKDRLDAEVIRDKFVDVANTTIRATMGNTYAEVVLTCLRSWGGEFGEGEKVCDQSHVALKYIELVVDRLSGIKF
ncbi:hypothetical protein BD410DRAFT_898829 [Rickenella mellea]|uniref:Protein kinase domain-containing protein n=1 Tax=Rickenella mellea TaxID=50990 RepID=A0A4Y7Q3U7_9AGAM|nr:hypothetical protein BD410DRAFT_898829 [Rickenella mellea]